MPNLKNYPQIVNEIQSWNGSGKLNWGSRSSTGDFLLSRLLNGRLRFVFRTSNPLVADRFVELSDLEFEGVAVDESSVSVTGIHFTRTMNGEGISTICVGFAERASIRTNTDTDTSSIRCDVTNYSLHRRQGNVQFDLDGFTIEIKRLNHGSLHKNVGVEEHAIAYQHASISTCLKIDGIPSSQIDQALESLQKIAFFLSIACRGNVYIVARHISNQEKGQVESLFEEPPFPDRRWGRPLIPTNVTENFLSAVCNASRNRVQNLALEFVRDHYLQALTLRSAWPLSVGIFTAMESLKKVFFDQNVSEENKSYNYWIVPEKKFTSNKKMVKDVIDILASHFPRFENLAQNEKQSLKDQIRHGLKRRSYKTGLKRMLNLLKVQYETSELQVFIDTRNRLIHEGTPVPANIPLNEYAEKTADAWQKVENAVALFERALLAFLKYDGPYELFNEKYE